MHARLMKTTLWGALALMLLAGCSASSSDGATPPTTPSEDGAPTEIADLIGDGDVLVDWDGAIQISAASPWSLRHIVGDAIPAGEQLHGEWSPDGGSVVFAFDSGDGTRDLWTADVETGEAELLLDCVAPCVWTDEPTFSPDGGTIAFIEGDADGAGNGIGSLRTVATDGAASAVHYESEPSIYPMSVAWSPDGTSWVVELLRFATTRADDAQTTGGAIGIVDAAGDLTMLTDFDAGFAYPDWSPDGATILMSDDDLWTVPAAGGAPSQITHLADEGGRALLGSYTADGRAIVFNVEQPTGATPAVAVMASSGGPFVPLGPGTHPTLRP